MRQIDQEVIGAQVAEARQRGFAVNMGYYLPGEGGLGLPLPRRSANEVNAAVSFNAPLEIMNDDWIEATIAELRDCLER